jgi:hypothetical protein
MYLSPRIEADWSSNGFVLTLIWFDIAELSFLQFRSRADWQLFAREQRPFGEMKNSRDLYE